jgi:hypothetical protein
MAWPVPVMSMPNPPSIPLQPPAVRLPDGSVVYAWAVDGRCHHPAVGAAQWNAAIRGNALPDGSMSPLPADHPTIAMRQARRMVGDAMQVPVELRTWSEDDVQWLQHYWTLGREENSRFMAGLDVLYPPSPSRSSRSSVSVWDGAVDTVGWIAVALLALFGVAAAVGLWW